MGRRRWTTRLTVEECFGLDIGQLVRAGAFDADPRTLCTSIWNDSAGMQISSITFRVFPDRTAHFSIIGRHQGKWTPLYTVTVLGLNTGMRHKEIRTLKWKNLDLVNRVLRVGESKTEAGKGRPIPLTQPAWTALDMWASRFPDAKPHDFVFSACENGHLAPERPIANWRTAWRRACREADLAGLRFHDLRHTAATKMLEQGTPIAVVAHILGWSASTAVRMVKRYGHIRPEAQRLALEAIATAEIRPGVNQIVHQVENALQSKLSN